MKHFGLLSFLAISFSFQGLPVLTKETDGDLYDLIFQSREDALALLDELRQEFRGEIDTLTDKVEREIQENYEIKKTLKELQEKLKNCESKGGIVEVTGTNMQHTTNITAYNPEGSTGCGRSLPGLGGGTCWRYCSGTSGDWCYTRPNCNHDKEACSTETECGGYTCAAASEGCVKTCNADSTRTVQKVPNGSTGCSKKYTGEEGRCWRYCKGTSGKWCYTSSQCMKDEDKCWQKTKCSGQSCLIAAPGCVRSCE